MGRSRGGLTSKIHAEVDRNGLPARVALSACEGTRQSAYRQTLVSPKVRNDAVGGPWLRRRLDQSPCRQERRLGQYPAKMQSQRPDLPEPVSLPCPKFGRAVLQQHPAVSQLATTNSRPTTSPSSSSRQYGWGCALVSPRRSLARQKRRRAELRKNLLGLGSDPPQRYRPSFHRQRSGPARNRRYHRSRSLIMTTARRTSPN
jgi:hypothetical protein